jgi:TolB protein
MRRPFGIAAIVLVAVAVPNASATLPGRNGIIVFKRYFEPDQWGALFTIGSNGRGEKQLTHTSRNVTDDQPDWSPDASLIVFTRCSPDTPCTIYTVKPDGSQLKRVSPKPCLPGPPQCEDGANASFLRDGRHVVYTRATGGERHFPNWDQIEHSDIVVRDLDGGNPRVLISSTPYRADFNSPPVLAGRLAPGLRSRELAALEAGAQARSLCHERRRQSLPPDHTVVAERR